MGLLIFLRKRATTNYFRDLVIDSIDTGAGNNVLLCSGFFQELFNHSLYQATLEKNFTNVLLNKNIDITTVGIHNNVWMHSYKNFRDNLQNSGVNIQAKYISSYRWHAKIFILKDKDEPVLGIVGSSNITRNAFSVSVPHNYEADVVMWKDSNAIINDFMKKYIDMLKEFPDEIIVADYDPQKNNGLSIEERLKNLENDINKQDLKDLPS
jgi:phosphatidylserine/phosphatidylglycerophosphate/cardiolipin synthase-like enzyme